MNSYSAGKSQDQEVYDNFGRNRPNIPEVFVKCEVDDKVENGITAETEDIDEEMQLFEKEHNESEIFVYKRGDVIFEELPNGKIKCGCCNKSFARILGHLSCNPICTLNIDFDELKTLWIKYECNQSNRIKKQKEKLNYRKYDISNPLQMELLEKSPGQMDHSPIKALTENIDQEFDTIKIDPSVIKTETEDIDEEMQLLEKGHNESERFVYQKGEVIFEQLPNGKIKCGSCSKVFVRILGHLMCNQRCALNIDLVEFKTRWIRYECKQRNGIQKQTEILRNSDQILRNEAARKRKYEIFNPPQMELLEEKNPDKMDLTHIKAEAENIDQELNTCKIDPSDIKVETEDIDEEFHNSDSFECNPSRTELLDERQNQSERILYQRGELIFEILPNGNIKCASCERPFVNILRHLTCSPTCALNIDFVELKSLWAKYKCKPINSRVEMQEEGHDHPERFVYKKGDVIFEQLPNGDVKCGVCKTSSANILRHLTCRPNCTLDIDFIEFKTLWIKYKCKQSKSNAKQNKVMEKSPSQMDPIHIKAEINNTEEECDHIKIDPSNIKSEIEDDDSFNINPYQMEFEKFVYQSGDFIFEQFPNGNVQCGTCKGYFGKILRHLTDTPKCASNIDLDEFKTLWTEHKTRQNERRRCFKKKMETTEKILKNQAERKRKYEKLKSNLSQMEKSPNHIDPIHIKAETEHPDEEVHNSDPLNESERFVYQRGEVVFEHVPGGKVKCGSCKGSFDRIVPHLAGSPLCALNVDVDEVKALWTKYKNKQHNRNKYLRKKLNNSEKNVLNSSQLQVEELDKSHNQFERFVYQRGDVIFQQLPDGKVQCGSCKSSCERILFHLSSNPACTLNIDFDELSELWTKHRLKQNKASYYQRKKIKHSEQILSNV